MSLVIILYYVEIFCMLLELVPLKSHQNCLLSSIGLDVQNLAQSGSYTLSSLSSSSHFICKLVVGKALDSPAVRMVVQPEMSVPSKIVHTHSSMTQRGFSQMHNPDKCLVKMEENNWGPGRREIGSGVS